MYHDIRHVRIGTYFKYFFLKAELRIYISILLHNYLQVPIYKVYDNVKDKNLSNRK